MGKDGATGNANALDEAPSEVAVDAAGDGIGDSGVEWLDSASVMCTVCAASGAGARGASTGVCRMDRSTGDAVGES